MNQICWGRWETGKCFWSVADTGLGRRFLCASLCPGIWGVTGLRERGTTPTPLPVPSPGRVARQGVLGANYRTY